MTMVDIHSRTAQFLKDRYGIEETITRSLFDKGVLQDNTMRKVLLREEYRERVEPGGKQILKGHLAQKYCVSVTVVERSIRQ